MREARSDNGGGLRCPCGGRLAVEHTQAQAASVKRRRKCTACGRRETTVERFADQDAAVTHRVRQQVEQIASESASNFEALRRWLDLVLDVDNTTGGNR